MKNCLITAILILIITGFASFSMAAEPVSTTESAAPPSTLTDDAASTELPKDDTTTASKQSSNAADVTLPSDTVSTPATSLKVYYFHTSRRCKTCLTIEANAKEAVEAGFPTEVAEGLVSWEEVDFEEKENAHFVKDLDLMFSSVIVVKYQDGKQVEWKNLQKVWELVRDKPAFTDYVKTEVQAWLEP